MMIGMCLVRSLLRSSRANAMPDLPGSIQSSSTRSGRTSLIRFCACSALYARIGQCPACCRFTEISSEIAGSSSMTRILLGIGTSVTFLLGWELTERFALELVARHVTHVRSLDDVDDEFGDVLRVVAD